MDLAKHHNLNQTCPLATRPDASPHSSRETAVFQILNDKGLHTRPATELVKVTSRFKAQAHLTYQNMTVNAKSLLGILILAAAKGAKITIEADGPDASDLIQGVLALARAKFNIRY